MFMLMRQGQYVRMNTGGKRIILVFKYHVYVISECNWASSNRGLCWICSIIGEKVNFRYGEQNEEICKEN